MKALALAASLFFSITIGGQSVDGNFGASKKNEKPPPPAAESAKPKVRSYPYHGHLDSVAADGTSLTLRGKTKLRRILVSKQTRISKGASNAALKEATPGERITGSVFRNADGNEQALTVRIGGTPKP
jgi:hypothetical protein